VLRELLEPSGNEPVTVNRKPHEGIRHDG
jgi:hypothetical protein